MSVEIISNGTNSVMICNTADVAFGPVFYEDEDAEQFLEWLSPDPRTLSDHDLAAKVTEWRELPECDHCDQRFDGQGFEFGNGATGYICQSCYENQIDCAMDAAEDRAIRENQK